MATPFPFVAGAVLEAAELNAITELPVSTKTDDYTLVAGDAGDRVVANKASAITFTVPNNVFTAAQCVFIHNIGTGTLTIAAGAGVTINSADVLTVAQYQSGTLLFASASSAIWFPSAKTVTTGAIIQVKSTTKSDTFSMSSSTPADVTGLSVSITPTNASNKVLVFGALSAGNNTNNSVSVYPRLMRDSTAIALGDTAGSRRRITSNASFLDNNSNMTTIPFMFLDSPATTSATTYKIQISAQTTNTIYVNRTNDDTDSDTYPRAISTITVMEVTP